MDDKDNSEEMKKLLDQGGMIWQEILKESTTKKEAEEANIFIFGDKDTGKKSLIRIMNKDAAPQDYESKTAVNSEENLSRAEELILQDISYDSLKSVVKNESLNGVKVRSPYFQEGDNVNVDEMEWNVGAVKVVPSTVDNTTTIIKILDVREPEPKMFNEVRGLITSAYQAKLEVDWIEALKAKYPVSVNTKILEKVKKYY